MCGITSWLKTQTKFFHAYKYCDLLCFALCRLLKLIVLHEQLLVKIEGGTDHIHSS